MTPKLLAAFVVGAAFVHGQNMPAEYDAVLKNLGKQGDFKADVLKVNIPRSDLKVSIDGIATPTPFGFGGWLAMTKGSGGHEVMMGDLVLLEDEVNPVMSALLDNGLEVTALHNHFFFESPRVFYMHVHGHGTAAELAKKVKPAVDLIGRGSPTHQSTVSGGASSNISGGQMDMTKIARLVGHEGEQSGQVYKITVGRDDIKLTDMGAKINARMGLNTWAAFYGTDANAEIAGDVAMLDTEITPVLEALRSHGINVVAIHNHMTGGQPFVYFLHYWGTGPAEKLATGFKAALDQLGHKQRAAAGADPVDRAKSTIVFVCEHGTAKSVVAAAHFNQLASREGLPYHAVARGLTPDSAIPAEVSRGLASDGLDVRGWQPRKVDETELSGAARVVTLGCDLPVNSTGARRDHWTDLPSITDNYQAGREAILSRVRELVAGLSDRRPE